MLAVMLASRPDHVHIQPPNWGGANILDRVDIVPCCAAQAAYEPCHDGHKATVKRGRGGTIAIQSQEGSL